MKLREVYEKYEHLDAFLSDQEWLGPTQTHQILYDLWQAIKQECEKKETKS